MHTIEITISGASSREWSTIKRGIHDALQSAGFRVTVEGVYQVDDERAAAVATLPDGTATIRTSGAA